MATESKSGQQEEDCQLKTDQAQQEIQVKKDQPPEVSQTKTDQAQQESQVKADQTPEVSQVKTDQESQVKKDQTPEVSQVKADPTQQESQVKTADVPEESKVNTDQESQDKTNQTPKEAQANTDQESKAKTDQQEQESQIKKDETPEVSQVKTDQPHQESQVKADQPHETLQAKPDQETKVKTDQLQQDSPVKQDQKQKDSDAKSDRQQQGCPLWTVIARLLGCHTSSATVDDDSIIEDGTGSQDKKTKPKASKKKPKKTQNDAETSTGLFQSQDDLFGKEWFGYSRKHSKKTKKTVTLDVITDVKVVDNTAMKAKIGIQQKQRRPPTADHLKRMISRDVFDNAVEFETPANAVVSAANEESQDKKMQENLAAIPTSAGEVPSDAAVIKSTEASLTQAVTPPTPDKKNVELGKTDTQQKEDAGKIKDQDQNTNKNEDIPKKETKKKKVPTATLR